MRTNVVKKQSPWICKPFLSALSVIAAATTLAMIASCGPASSSSVSGPPFHELKPRKGNGVVYFYMPPYRTMTIELGTMIWDQKGKDIVYLKNGGYFPYECRAGKHVFYTKHVPLIVGGYDELTVHVKAGAAHYVYLKNATDSQLKLADPQTGSLQIAKCNKLPSE